MMQSCVGAVCEESRSVESWKWQNLWCRRFAFWEVRFLMQHRRFFFLHHHIFAIKQQYDYTIEYHVTFYYCICILTIRWVRQLLTPLVYTQIRENYIHIVKVYTEWFLPPHHLVYCSCAKADPLSEDEVFPFREKPPSADWRTLWNNTASKSKFVT